MSNDLQKPSILERFRALLTQRDNELRISGEDDDSGIPPPSSEEIVQLYELVLSDLTFNSKPLITDLTIIAGEHREHGQGIADAICSRILEVPVELKLPSLYLLDSIVKNIGPEYIRYFSSHLPMVFCEAYRQVNPNLHPSMRHLFGTWSEVFPPFVLRKIEVQLSFSGSINNPSTSLTASSAFQLSQPDCGIHVNPKYSHQLDKSAGDKKIQHAVGPFSPSSLGPDRSFSPKDDEFAAGSPGRFVERASSSRQISDYGLGRLIDRDKDMNDWQGRKQYETSFRYNLTTGQAHHPARALIDAYGSDSREKTINVDLTLWQNSEEEEFNWENMSPTLSGRGRNPKILPASLPPSRSYEAMHGFGAPSAVLLEADYRRSGLTNQNPMSSVGDTLMAENALPYISSTRGSTSTMFPFQTKMNQPFGSRYPQDPWNNDPSLQKHANAGGRGKRFQMSSAGRVSSSIGEQMTSLSESFPDARQYHRPLDFASRMALSSIDSMNAESGSAIFQSSKGLWPPKNVQTSQFPPLRPIHLQQTPIYSQLDMRNACNMALNIGPSQDLFIPDQHLDGFGGKVTYSVKLPRPVAPQNQERSTLQSQFFQSHKARGNVVNLASPLTNGYKPDGHGTTTSTVLSNPVPGQQLPSPAIPNNSFLLPRGALLPQPIGPFTPWSHSIPGSQGAGPGPTISKQPHGSAFSGLIGNLVEQGLISATQPAPTQDSVGIEFNPDHLKIRHESAIKALYFDLPRQCTTCGLRFKCQEEHSSHMDWHVTRNRMSKNRKQNLCRKWFVTASMWLRGALGTEAVPGFLPAVSEEENKDDKDLAVPADEDQNACALCGEPFDDFYSDETEEWMYRGAVYVNAPNGWTTGMDRSQLGPIVHDKCRSESSAVSLENVIHDGEGIFEESSERKRTRF